MVLFAVSVLGLVSVRLIPVSLMPEVDIPQITVRVTVEGASARQMDAYMQPVIRELMQVTGLRDISSVSNGGTGLVRLKLEYGARTDLIFVDVSERIDKAMSYLPAGTERPKVIRAGATDIPAFFLNITSTQSSGELDVSRLASSVISKRIEQIPQVAMVDLSGLVTSELLIIPRTEMLVASGITPQRLAAEIAKNDIELGNLSIRDGQYHWDVRFRSELTSKEDIENIKVNLDGRVFLFSDLAQIIEQPCDNDCVVRSDGARAISMAIIKQNDARMQDLRSALQSKLEEFERDYPGVEFTITRDQTGLLRYTIDNLFQNLIVGILLASLVIILFMRNFRFSLLIIPTIVASLLASLLALYLLGMSINIISLAGLIMCVGMMVDNSIIVIDNITQRWERGDALEDAVAKGAGEVFAPMLSSILTTCAVFVPLVFLSGLAGEIFFDQAVTISVGLLASLLFAVLVVPVYYYALYRKKGFRVDNVYLSRLTKYTDWTPAYEKALKWCFRRRWLVMLLMLLSVPVSAFLFTILDKSTFPPITQDDTILWVDWNSPLSVAENDMRTSEVAGQGAAFSSQVTQMSGIQQFLMPHTQAIGKTEALVYFKATSPEALDSLIAAVSGYMVGQWPEASFGFGQADNLFSLIFSDDQARLVARIGGRDGKTPDPDRLNRILSDVQDLIPEVQLNPVQWQEQVLLTLDATQMSLYDLSYDDVSTALRQFTRGDRVFFLRSGDYSMPVVMADGTSSTDLLSATVRNSRGVDIPLRNIATESRGRDLKTIVSGMSGNYYPLELNLEDSRVGEVMAGIRDLSFSGDGFDVSFTGSYFSSREMIKELLMIVLVAILLLYFILSAQFESLVQPVIILSEIVVDMVGALLLLWLCGGGINAMSLIGIVVMSGIVINDSILKVDTINRLRKENGYGLLRAIMTGGTRRFSPIIMTTLTTVLAMVPFLSRGDMGSDLQYPLSVVMIGGMIVGVIVSIFGIPLIYYLIYRKKGRTA